MKTLYLLPLLAASGVLFASCESTPQNMTLRDSQGNYASTSDYRAMNRTDFFRSMNAGLQDFDAQLSDLRARANKLGGSTLREFAECEEALTEKRTGFVSQLAVAQNAMDNSWPDEREETVDTYVDLRNSLSESYKDVLDT